MSAFHQPAISGGFDDSTFDDARFPLHPAINADQLKYDFARVLLEDCFHPNVPITYMRARLAESAPRYWRNPFGASLVLRIPQERPIHRSLRPPIDPRDPNPALAAWARRSRSATSAPTSNIGVTMPMQENVPFVLVHVDFLLQHSLLMRSMFPVDLGLNLKNPAYIQTVDPDEEFDPPWTPFAWPSWRTPRLLAPTNNVPTALVPLPHPASFPLIMHYCYWVDRAVFMTYIHYGVLPDITPIARYPPMWTTPAFNGSQGFTPQHRRATSSPSTWSQTSSYPTTPISPTFSSTSASSPPTTSVPSKSPTPVAEPFGSSEGGMNIPPGVRSAPLGPSGSPLSPIERGPIPILRSQPAARPNVPSTSSSSRQLSTPISPMTAEPIDPFQFKERWLGVVNNLEYFGMGPDLILWLRTYWCEMRPGEESPRLVAESPALPLEEETRSSVGADPRGKGKAREIPPTPDLRTRANKSSRPAGAAPSRSSAAVPAPLKLDASSVGASGGDHGSPGPARSPGLSNEFARYHPYDSEESSAGRRGSSPAANTRSSRKRASTMDSNQR